MTGTGTVTGTVTRGDGKSAAGLYVIAGVNGLKWVVQTDLNAAFAFSALSRGRYHSVEVLDPRDFNRTIVSGTVTLLAAGDIQDIFALCPGQRPCHGHDPGHGIQTRRIDLAERGSAADRGQFFLLYL